MTAMRAFLFLLAMAPAASVSTGESAMANPIRRVVGMLQMMEKKIEAEGEKEQALFDKFMCYCENGKGALQKSIDDAGNKVPQVGADIKAAVENKAMLEQEMKEHQTSRDAAKEAIASATAVREKEAAEFATTSADLETNIAALTKATAAVEKGMSASFLQSQTAGTLKKIVMNSEDMSDVDRDLMTSFLAEGADAGYSPQSGGILGILKQIGDTMAANLKSATAAEDQAMADFDALMAAKTKEINANTKAIETKTVRVGELGVKIVQMEEDLDDTGKALIEDKKFLADLDKNCATKKGEWDEICKMRAEEQTAIAETITLLNDDDALELFKKTLPSASLLQVVATASSVKSRALSMVRELRQRTRPGARTPVDLIALALTGKKVSFDKVLKMIDDLVAALAKEQQEDEHKKEYCEGQLDTSDDKKKGLQHDLADLESLIEETTDDLKTTAADIKALEESIVALDKSVAEATADRKEENEDYTALMASDTAAKDLLGMAKNRLNKFYNPKLYKEPAAALVQIRAHTTDEEAPAPPPEAPGAYKKKRGQSGGVIAMIDGLIAELDQEITEAEATEKNSQEDYETFMNDSAEQRTMDSKTLGDKTGVKAELETTLAKAKSDSSATMKELMATEEYISGLHGECDFLLQNFDLRKSAREGEVDSLKKAKAVLSGADFSLLQQSRHVRALRGA